MAADFDRTRDRITEAFAEIMGESGEMVTRWVALVEVIDEDGQRALWALAPDGQKAWDSLGILDYARAREHAAVVADAIRDE